MVLRDSNYTYTPDVFYEWLPFITENEIRVLLAIFRISDMDIELISEKSGISTIEVIENLELLEERGILTIIKKLINA